MMCQRHWTKGAQLAGLTLGLAWGCHSRGEQPQKAPLPATTPAIEQEAATTETSKTTCGYVCATVALRVAPTDARTVAPSDEPTAPKNRWRTNQKAQLVRGERLEIIGEAQQSFVHVRVSDGAEGFVKSDGVLLGTDLTPATVLQPERLFTRPDLLALAGNRQLEPGDLVFVLRQKEQFCHINTQGQATAWVLCRQLERQPDEVDAAKLMGRARFFARSGDSQAQALEQLARSHFSHTRLVQQWLALSPPLSPESARGGAQETAPEETISAPGAGAADEHGEVHETADPGTASPRGYDDPAAGPPELGAPLEPEAH